MHLCIFAFMQMKNAWFDHHVHLSVRLSALFVLINHWTDLNQIRRDCFVGSGRLDTLNFIQWFSTPRLLTSATSFAALGPRVQFLLLFSNFLACQIFLFFSRIHDAYQPPGAHLHYMQKRWFSGLWHCSHALTRTTWPDLRLISWKNKSSFIDSFWWRIRLVWHNYAFSLLFRQFWKSE